MSYFPFALKLIYLDSHTDMITAGVKREVLQLLTARQSKR